MSSSSFKAKVNGQKDFSFQKEQLRNLDAILTDPATYHVLCNEKSYEVTVVEQDFNNRFYEVRIGSNTYQVDIETDLDQLIQSMGYQLSSEQAVDTIQAPMPGIILDVRVSKGDSIKKGSTLLILEAMKMENVIVSPKDGVVKKVHASTGQTVDKNKLLIELE
jgi:biotin carboxyl carrier protein